MNKREYYCELTVTGTQKNPQYVPWTSLFDEDGKALPTFTETPSVSSVGGDPECFIISKDTAGCYIAMGGRQAKKADSSNVTLLIADE